MTLPLFAGGTTPSASVSIRIFESLFVDIRILTSGINYRAIHSRCSLSISRWQSSLVDHMNQKLYYLHRVQASILF